VLPAVPAVLATECPSVRSACPSSGSPKEVTEAASEAAFGPVYGMEELPTILKFRWKRVETKAVWKTEQ
jgi:hypothetical protein